MASPIWGFSCRIKKIKLTGLKGDILIMPTAAKKAATTRTESDTMGDMQVPADKYYGALTARSL